MKKKDLLIKSSNLHIKMLLIIKYLLNNLIIKKKLI